MSAIGRLQRAGHVEPRQHFANGYEMAGYYAAHFFNCLQHYGMAPTQVGILGGDNIALHGMLGDSLNLPRLIAEPLPGASALVTIRDARPRARRNSHALIMVREQADQVEVDLMLPYMRLPHRRGIEVGAPVIIDLAGVPLEERELAKVACMFDFNAGWARYQERLATV